MGEKALAKVNGKDMQILSFYQQNHICKRKKTCEICCWLLFWKIKNLVADTMK